MEVPSEMSCWPSVSDVELKQSEVLAQQLIASMVEGSDGEASGLKLFKTGLEEPLHVRYIDLRSARQLSVSLEKLQDPMNGDAMWQDDVTESGTQPKGDDVVSKDIR